MASSSRPTTPKNGPQRGGMNRAVTLPLSISTASKPLDGPDKSATADGVETLFTHPNATVVKFTTLPSPRPIPTSSSPARPGSSAGMLPWASSGETTIAAGPLEIYRVPGSVSFLRSGTLLHAIMPRSQCWCVDGVSKFVLRVLADTYYRIELPGLTDDDLQKVGEMKITLQKVLFYERSACPFSRTFSLDLPEMPDVKTRRLNAAGPAKKWKMDRAFSWKPEGYMHGDCSTSGEIASSRSPSPDDFDEEAKDEEHRSIKQESSFAISNELADGVKGLSFGTPTEPRPLQSLRSVSAPASHLAPPQAATRQVYTGANVDGAVDAIETAEATHRSQNDTPQRNARSSGTVSFQAMPTDMPPSPPDSSAGLDPTNIRDAQPMAQQFAEDEDHSQSLERTDVPPQVEPLLGMDGYREEVSTNQIYLSEETKEYIREIEERSDDLSFDATTIETPSAAEQRETDPSQDPVSSGHSLLDDSALVEEAEPSDDPYAAIRARIQARRSIGGTTSFHPVDQKTSSASSMSSTSSSGTIASNKSSISHASTRHQHALATALVKKACSAVLGPPANLVALMLRIAARFANAAFGVDSMFYVATPVHTQRSVPGSFRLGEGLSSDEELDEDDEDDFGVPIRSPVRLAQRNTSSGAGMGQASSDGLKERRRMEDAG